MTAGRSSGRNGCPICGKPATIAHRPFCGQGCKDRDLLQWLNEGYRIPASPVSDDDEAERPGVPPPADA